MTAKLVKWDFCSDLFPPCKIEYKNCSGDYVSDALDTIEINSWVRNNPRDLDNSIPYRAPVIISAQTGKGKNYFITHTLRQYAKENEERILYISNRVALDYQQKKELAAEAGIEQSREWENQDDFGNVTVLTYHKLLGRLKKPKCESWANRFTYVVLDECHFFYSDAYFNPSTWEVLTNIIEKFRNRVRIYLSATLEDVIDPIRYLEGNILEKYYPKCEQRVTCYDIDEYIKAYNFPRDFSNYSVSFFSDWKDLINKILKSSEKWIIFVTSKNIGQTIKNSLLLSDGEDEVQGNQNVTPSDVVTYMDSDTRKSEQFEDKYVWDQLLKEGKFRSKVLITTSVLDNGFSIKDKQVKNIVLFTHDRTEFLQELGRCRITSDCQVKLYISKLTPVAHERRKQQFKAYSRLMEDIYGDGTSFKQGDIVKAVQNLWTSDSNQLRGCISLENEGNGLLRPTVNEMAKWRTFVLGRQIAEFEQLMKQDSDADSSYKTKWLDTVYNQDQDLDYNKQKEAIKHMQEHLDNQVDKLLNENADEFTIFSEKFFDLFVIIDPKNKAINRGRGHGNDCWKSDAIKNRLNDLKKFGLYYTLKKEKGIGNKPCVTIIKSSEGQKTD